MGTLRAETDAAENTCNPAKQREGNWQALVTGEWMKYLSARPISSLLPFFGVLWQSFWVIDASWISPDCCTSRWGEPAGSRQKAGRPGSSTSFPDGFFLLILAHSCWRAGIWTMPVLWSRKTKVAFYSGLLRKAVALQNFSSIAWEFSMWLPLKSIWVMWQTTPRTLWRYTAIYVFLIPA